MPLQIVLAAVLAVFGALKGQPVKLFWVFRCLSLEGPRFSGSEKCFGSLG